MARYTFTVRTEAKSAPPDHAVELKDDAAALAYACDLARDLAQRYTDADPAWQLVVADEKRARVYSFTLPAPEGRRSLVHPRAPRRPTEWGRQCALRLAVGQ
jgi:hypothetical protein